jgi:hypothetical protein
MITEQLIPLLKNKRENLKELHYQRLNYGNLVHDHQRRP